MPPQSIAAFLCRQRLMRVKEFPVYDLAGMVRWRGIAIMVFPTDAQNLLAAAR
jgi:hypothetical protein